MNSKSQSFKIYLGSAYLVIFLTGIYFFLSNFEISQLTSYDLIKENRGLILGYKENNIFFLSIIFFIITIFLNLLLCPMLLPTLIIGFIFGKWLGTLILILGNTFGGFLLYRIAKTFFSDLIEKKFKTRFSKFIDFFNKNDVSISSNGVLYDLKQKGVIPAILEKWFNERVEYRKLAKKYKYSKLFSPLRKVTVSPAKVREYEKLHNLIWKHSRFGG